MDISILEKKGKIVLFMNRRKSLKKILVFATKYFVENNVENGHLYPGKRKGKSLESYS